MSKSTKYLNRYFSNEVMQVVNKHINMCNAITEVLGEEIGH